jgi:hypothetical protein
MSCQTTRLGFEMKILIVNNNSHCPKLRWRPAFIIFATTDLSDASENQKPSIERKKSNFYLNARIYLELKPCTVYHHWSGSMWPITVINNWCNCFVIVIKEDLWIDIIRKMIHWLTKHLLMRLETTSCTLALRWLFLRLCSAMFNLCGDLAHLYNIGTKPLI